MRSTSNVLPRRRPTSRIIRRQSRKPQTFVHRPSRHVGIAQPLHVREYLPWRRTSLCWTSQEPSCSQAREAEVSKLRPGCKVEGVGSRAGRDGARVGLREAEAAGGSYVDDLTARNFDVLGGG